MKGGESGCVGGESGCVWVGRVVVLVGSEFYFARALFCASSIRLPIHSRCVFCFYIPFLFTIYASNNNEFA